MSTKEIIDLVEEDLVPGILDDERPVAEWGGYEEDDDDASAESETGMFAAVVRWCDRVDDRSSVKNAEYELQQCLAELKCVADDCRNALAYFGSESASLVQALVEFGGAVSVVIGTQYESILREALLSLAAWTARMPRD